MVLQVTADAGQPDLGRDAGRLQMVFRADAGPQQYLRRIYSPARQNHLAPGPCGAGVVDGGVLGLPRDTRRRIECSNAVLIDYIAQGLKREAKARRREDGGRAPPLYPL